MRTSVESLSPPSSGTQAATCLLVRPAASAMSDAIQDGLRAAGLDAAVVSNVFDAVVEAEHAAQGQAGSPAKALTQTIVCVDHFGQQDFRLFPLMRREWPETLIVAFHSPGFDYKGRLAELLGADVVLGSAADVAEWAKSLVPAAGEPPARPAPEPPPSPPPSAPTGLPPAAAYQYLAQAPEPPPAANASSPPPSAPPAEVKPAAPPPDDDEWVEGDVIGTIELTEDELRLLLGEEKDA